MTRTEAIATAAKTFALTRVMVEAGYQAPEYLEADLNSLEEAIRAYRQTQAYRIGVEEIARQWENETHRLTKYCAGLEAELVQAKRTKHEAIQAWKTAVDEANEAVHLIEEAVEHCPSCRAAGHIYPDCARCLKLKIFITNYRRVNGQHPSVQSCENTDTELNQ